MIRKSPTASAAVTRRGFAAGVGAAGLLAGTAPFGIVRAQGAPLKVGVLLPRSGVQAGIGQDCQRGVEIAAGILKASACRSLQIMNGDTETNVDIARARAEKLINEGAQLLVGAFDSGQTTAIAQVAEQKGIPFVINIAAAPPITEQGYKFVFRNFPTAPMILGDAFANQKEMFESAGKAPKTVVFMHVNDTFGIAMQKGVGAHDAEVQHALQDRRDDRLRPDRARSVGRGRQGQGDRRRSAAGGQPAERCDPDHPRTGQAALEPDGHAQHGPGWYEDQYLKTLGKLSDGPMSFVPWYDPNKKLSQAARSRARQGVSRAST